MKSIAVIFGGTSSEHVISLKTGKFIYQTLLKRGRKVIPILYTVDGKWITPNDYQVPFPDGNFTDPIEFENQFRSFYKSTPGVFPTERKIDLCFLGLHGGTGENGAVQGFLDILQIPYTGSSITASSVAMDKFLSYQLFEKNGFFVSPYFEINKNHFKSSPDFIKRLPNYPYFVKPTCGGSSVSTGIVRNPDEALPFLEKLFLKDERAIFQIPTRGVEVSCGVIERWNGSEYEPNALYPTEILPGGEFFDFESKYKSGGSKEITPARISNELTDLIRSLAIKAHLILGCRGYSRTDFIISKNIPYILETNTLPGMTETSLIPQQVAYQNEDMSDILDLIIENALYYSNIYKI